MFRQFNVLLKIILLHTVCDTVSVARPDTAQLTQIRKYMIHYDVISCDMNDNGTRLLNVTLIRLLMLWQIFK